MATFLSALSRARRRARWAVVASLALASAGASAQFTLINPPAPEDFEQISAGAFHTCARKVGGKTYCWGLNHQGQVGIPSSTLCGRVACIPRPAFVMNARQVDAGGSHSCAIGTDGRGFCWGNNSNGQIGDGSGVGPQPVPKAIAGNLSFKEISAGVFGTCATTTTGMFCWGNITNTAAPARLSANTDFRSPAVGEQHACMIHELWNINLHEAYCFGNNQLQQTGVSPALWSGPVPFAFTTSLGRDTFTVSASNSFTCGDKGNGQVHCMGDNGWGQLGAGDFVTTFQARPVGGGTLALRGVSAGWIHACALDAGNRAHCWGNGNNGQLGQGRNVTTVSPNPLPVVGGRTYRAIAAGSRHTCAIGTDNRIYCWGDNTHGQLGLGAGGGWYGDPVQALAPPN
ncbi:MAG TPA: hypothetical protein VFQ20_05215 [Burkholderiaceae bacterium]|nr:hypothetical protein [Burkholderiaceae bacterium]